MTRGYAAALKFDRLGNFGPVAVVWRAMEALSLPLQESPPPYEVRRFSNDGSVVVRGSTSSVFIGGTMIGEFDERDPDRGRRNVLAVTLAKSDEFHLGRLASAFGITDEYLRQLRRKEEAEGLGSLLLSKQGKESKVTAEQRAAWCTLFAAGGMPIDAYRSQPRSKNKRLSYATVWRVYEKWQRDASPASSEPSAESTPEATAPVAGQLTLPSTLERVHDQADGVETTVTNASGKSVSSGKGGATPDEDAEDIVPMAGQPVRGGKMVQHVGCWILLALVKELGLHEEANRAFESQHVDGLRIALDAVICALAIYQRCVEGVRRLATPTGATLLRAERVPSANGVRKLLGRLLERVEGGATALDACIAERLMARARTCSDDNLAVFYVDNHLRCYTGKHVVRKGWRMQDKRVLPGATDYYVHDEDGRPVFRIPVASHDSLTSWLSPIATRLRDGLGPGERILLAFDRGGAYAKQLVALRDAGFEFVTYERKPYPQLAASVFEHSVVIRGETYRFHESRLKNLGAGRGRLRRIALLASDGSQINLVAISTAPAERLIEILMGDEPRKMPSGRWQQENAFKHGDRRWGINQLDGRRVESYPPGTVIPNPARNRIDRSLRLARAAEGDARSSLARLPDGDPRRAAVEHDLASALELQRELEDLRPSIPKHAPVEDTELAGKLVRHLGTLKSIIDVIRLVCANAESDLATMLAPHLNRPREAKRVIANIFAAPGKVAVTDHAIHVRLAPAANRSERTAIEQLLAALNQRNLTLPGDPATLPLHFDLQPL